MNKNKIAIIGLKGLPATGGAAAASEQIVEILKDKYEFTVYAIDTHTTQKGSYNGVKQIVFKGYQGKRKNTFFYYFKSLLHSLFRGNYDLIHVNHTSCGFIVPFLKMKYKVIGTAHGIVPKNDNKWNVIDKNFFNFFSFLFFRFSDISVSVAKPHIEIFKKYTSKPILYIPNGIKLQNNAEQDSISEREPYLLFAASRIIALKGCHIFLEALNLLSYQNPVIIVGNMIHTPKYTQQLIEMSRGLNIEFKELITDRAELNKIIKKAKLFVFPSFNEGMSNMLLEVASLKTPIICSDIPENKVIFDDSMVLFFQTGNSRDLAEKIQFALNNPELMQTKANNAFLHLKNEFLWEKIAQQYDELYQSLLTKKS